MRKYRRRTPVEEIPVKANRILNLILIAFFFVLLRVWHLGVIQHDARVEQSRRPQERVIVEPSKRGTIRDRFNQPLAINKVQYNASILYSEIRQVPSIAWEFEGDKKVKKYKRRDHITQISHLLGEELGMDPDRIEDLIHSKAALFNHLPFVIKEDISEREYYRLKMLEKDWLGIHTQHLPRRFYPKGKVAADIVGYMGAISREEYLSVVQEIKSLETFLEEWELGVAVDLPDGYVAFEDVKKRLEDLVEHAYGINDYVGKAGVEGNFEEELRGFHGKKRYFSDARGNFLRELPDGREPLSGRRLILSISSELQEYAEKLLVQNEEVRKPRLSRVKAKDLPKLDAKPPWIKGGAIVAMDPISGEVLALASHPRFDPNDYITTGNVEDKKRKNSNIRKWFETESFVAEVWDQKKELERELYDKKSGQFYEEQKVMNWDNYLQAILSVESPVLDGMSRVSNIQNSVSLQNNVEKLLYLSGQTDLYAVINEIYHDEPHVRYNKRLGIVAKENLEEKLRGNQVEIGKIKRLLDPYLSPIPNNYDKVLLVDLCQLAVDGDRFSTQLLAHSGQHSLSFYRDASAAFVEIQEAVYEMVKGLFHELAFLPWREENQKEFLKQKRLEEKELGIKYAKPYIDLLDQKERELFAQFWERYRLPLLITFVTGQVDTENGVIAPYSKTLLTWNRELNQGAHQAISWYPKFFKLKSAIEQLPASLAKEYLLSFRGYSDLQRPLYGSYRNVRKENGEQLEKHLASAFYPIYGYGYGRSYAYRQAATQGSIFKLVTSYAALLQRYEFFGGGSLSYDQLNPLKINDDYFTSGKAMYVGYDEQGKPIPQLYKGGRLPKSLRRGMGKLDIKKAIELSSNCYFSLLAGDVLENPDDLTSVALQLSFGDKTGIDLPYEIPGRVPDDLSFNRNGLYAAAIGQHSLVVTPLQTAVMLSTIANGGKVLRPKILNMVVGASPRKEELVEPVPTDVVRELSFPPEIREILLEGMERVVRRTQTVGLPGLSNLYRKYPEAIGDYLELKGEIIGKSSTAESMEFLDLDQNLGTNMYNHTWFGGVCFKKDQDSESYLFKDKYGNPEIVVVVYLRCGAWGKDAAPVAAQVAKKWRQIKAKSI